MSNYETYIFEDGIKVGGWHNGDFEILVAPNQEIYFGADDLPVLMKGLRRLEERRKELKQVAAEQKRLSAWKNGEAIKGGL